MPHVELPQAEFKVVLLGDTNTGKTSLVLRFVEGYYRSAGRSSTIGAFFLTKRITVSHRTCKMLLWDTAGQEQFQKLAVTYYRDAAAAVLTYDVSNPRSVLRMRHWLSELQQNTADRKIVLAVAACKSDLEGVPGLQEEARELAKSVDAIYVETSAKDNSGVVELFSQLAERVLECQKEAATGIGPAIPVTVGGHISSRSFQSPLSETSFRKRNNGSYTHSSIGLRRAETAGSPPTSESKGMTYATTTTPATTTSRSKSSGGTGLYDGDSATADESLDAPLADSENGTNNNNDNNNASIHNNAMCEGSLLACGSGDPTKSCNIL